MTLLPHVLVGLPRLLQREHLLVEDRLDVIRLNSPHHILHLRPRADVNSPESADVLQSIQDLRIRIGTRLCTANEADDTDHSFEFDGLQTLPHRRGTTNFQDVVDTLAVRSELASCFTPVRVLLVVQDVIGAEFLEGFGLFSRGCGCNNSGAGGFSELQEDVSTILLMVELSIALSWGIGKGIEPGGRKR